MLKRYLIKGLLIFAIFLLLVAGKVFYLQRSHFITGENFYREANWKAAIREYDFAMHFYMPWSPYIEKSARRLWQMGEMFERQNKLDWAVIPYSSIRSSFYASRSLFTPGKPWINKCDEKLADLNVKMLIKEGSLKAEEAGAEKTKFLHAMRVDKAPNPLWSVLMGMSFFAWIGSIIFIIVKGFSNDGTLRSRASFYGMASFSIAFILWVVALLKA